MMFVFCSSVWYTFPVGLALPVLYASYLSIILPREFFLGPKHTMGVFCSFAMLRIVVFSPALRLYFGVSSFAIIDSSENEIFTC